MQQPSALLNSAVKSSENSTSGTAQHSAWPAALCGQSGTRMAATGALLSSLPVPQLSRAF